MGDEEMTMTREMRKKYFHVEDSDRLRLKAGGRDVYYLCDVIDELEGILQDVQHSSPVSIQNTIERRLFAAMTKKP